MAVVSTEQAIGAAMVVVLFVGLFVVIGVLDGWRLALTAFVITSVLVGWVLATSYFLAGGEWS